MSGHCFFCERALISAGGDACDPSIIVRRCSCSLFIRSPVPLWRRIAIFVGDTHGGEAILIDAPWQIVDVVTRLMAELGVRVSLIACTHGHWDHTMGVHELLAATHAEVACHPLDAELLEHPSFAPFNFPFELHPVAIERFLEEGDHLAIGEHRLQVLHTPGTRRGASACTARWISCSSAAIRCSPVPVGAWICRAATRRRWYAVCSGCGHCPRRPASIPATAARPPSATNAGWHMRRSWKKCEKRRGGEDSG